MFFLALNRFNTWMSNGMLDDQPINNFKYTIYCLGIQNGNETVWKRMWERFGNVSKAREKKIILAALGCSGNETIQRVISKFSDQKTYLRSLNRCFVIKL